MEYLFFFGPFPLPPYYAFKTQSLYYGSGELDLRVVISKFFQYKNKYLICPCTELRLVRVGRNTLIPVIMLGAH